MGWLTSADGRLRPASFRVKTLCTCFSGGIRLMRLRALSFLPRLEDVIQGTWQDTMVPFSPSQAMWTASPLCDGRYCWVLCLHLSSREGVSVFPVQIRSLTQQLLGSLQQLGPTFACNILVFINSLLISEAYWVTAVFNSSTKNLI